MTKVAGSGSKPAGNRQAAKPEKILKSGLPASIGKATQFKKGQSGNPAGPAPGRINLSTHIQNLLNDENFTTWLPDPKDGWKEFHGVPMKAIIGTAIQRAIAGDTKCMDWLAKYGYGAKIDPTDEDGNVRRIALVEFVSRARTIDEPDQD